MNVTDKSSEYAKQIADKLKEAGIRTELDVRAEKIGYKIKMAQMQKIPNMIIVGENEVAAGTISVRKRGNIELKDVKLDDFIAETLRQIKTREKN